MTKHKKILSVLLFSSFITISCSDKKEANQEAETETSVETQTDTIVFKSEDERAERQKTLQMFTTLPPELEGCSCYFGSGDEGFKAKQYAFASTLEKEGYAMINGNMTKLQLVKTESITSSHSRKEYANGKYSIVIETEKTGQVDETWQQKGKLMFLIDGQEIFYIDISGECGC